MTLEALETARTGAVVSVDAMTPDVSVGASGRAAEDIDPHAVIETRAADGAAPASAELGALASAVPPRESGRLPAEALDRPSTRARSARHVPASPTTPLAAYELLARSARLGDLVALTERVVAEGARSRVADWRFGASVAAAAAEAKLSREDAETPFGNVLDVLGTGGEGAAERALAAALWAHAVAETPRARSEDEDRLAGDVLWLATHSAFDATSLLDRALGDEASELWRAIADRVRRIDAGKGGALGRAEAIVGGSALAVSTAGQATALAESLSKDVTDPVLLRVLAVSADRTAPVTLRGELAAPPRGALATTLLAATGVLLLVHVVRLAARVALAYQRPAEVAVSSSGVVVRTRTVMLGRTLREREYVVPSGGLARARREVRFPRAAFYAGLLALAFGSYVGVRAFVDGVRSASPSLLAAGLGIVALGIAADFVLGSVIPGARRRCQLTFVPRSGPPVCIGDVDVDAATDAMKFLGAYR